MNARTFIASCLLSILGYALSNCKELNDSIHYCSSARCVLLDENDLTYLLQQTILTKHQVEYLYEHYTIHHIDDTSPPIHDHPTNETQDDVQLDADMTAYNVVVTFLSTANLLYCCGCSILTCAYIILLFWFLDSPYIQILLTLTYHYIYHTIAALLSHTIASRILSAILYICCCNMPTIALFIYFIHPKLCDGSGLLIETRDTINSLFVSNANHEHDLNVNRWDIFFARQYPTKIFICAILLCITSMVTPFIYAFTFETEFIGIFGVFTATLYILLILLAVFSLKSDRINHCVGLVSKSCIYGDCRCVYVSIVYWISMFITGYVTDNQMLSTVCLISGLNAFCWSFPVFLFIDVFAPKMNINWDAVNNMTTNNTALDSINVILSLLQQRSIRYKAFVLTNILINYCILRMCMYYQSWIAVPYAVGALFCLSYTIKADMKWSLAIHLPIAYSLFKACFAYLYIVDVQTLHSLSWIAPQNVVLWIITTTLRYGTSVVASLQMTRAIYWIALPPRQWTKELDIQKLCIHACTLYIICIVFLYFTVLEPNVLISLVFECFGISYGSTLVLSMREILVFQKKPWVWFITNMCINLRFYVLSDALVVPRVLTFGASLWSLSLLDNNNEMYLSTDTDATIVLIASIVLYSIFGLMYDCSLLLLTAIVLLCGYVAFKVWQKTNSKRAALMVLSLLALILIQIGLRFEMGAFNSLFSFGIAQQSPIHKTLELSIINYYFHNIFF